MNPTRLLGLLLALAGLGWGTSGCLSPPEYDIVPEIEFKDMKVTRGFDPDSKLPIDTFRITVNYRDGDGDLGITNGELALPPYNAVNPDKTPNKNQEFNYQLRLYRRTPPSTLFEEVFPKEYYGHYPVLYEGAYKPMPLKGELTYRQDFPLTSPLDPGDEVKFTVSIKDRAFHQSNTVESNTHKVVR